jgi:hypothetical protein
MAQQVRVSPQFRKLCMQFGRILGGESEIEAGPVCFVTRMTNLKETILGRRTRSPLVQMQMFSFESLDSSGRALCLGETALHQDQVNRLITNLRKRGIKVTAIHNHWLKENPRLLYMPLGSHHESCRICEKNQRFHCILG